MEKQVQDLSKDIERLCGLIESVFKIEVEQQKRALMVELAMWRAVAITALCFILLSFLLQVFSD